MEVEEDVSANIKTDQIGQRQRPHRMFVSQNHGCVDVLGAGDAIGEHTDGFVAENDTEAAGGKAGDVPDKNRGFAHGGTGGLRRCDGGLGCPIVLDHLKQFHDGDRIEEMHSNHLLWTVGDGGNIGDGKR